MAGFDFDLFVIGAGSGGVRAARMSAVYGAKVAIAEEHRIGGTCVIRGCVPKKLFTYASGFRDAFEDARGFGWSADNVRFDWATLKANKNAEIERLSGLYNRGLVEADVTIFRDRAVLTGPNGIKLIEDGKTVTAKTILIAAGAWPVLPDMPGSEHLVTSNECFELEQLPASVVVIGGGYIALEFAGIFRGLGSEVTLVHRGPRLLRRFDADLAEAVAEAMQERGIEIRLDARVEMIEERNGRHRVYVTGGEMVDADLALAATGRKPHTAGLGVNRAGVVCGWNGNIVVDDYSRTNVANIYAVGDVSDRVALTPIAVHEGTAFAETVYNDNPTPVDHSYIPTAVFSRPELAAVGMTEDEARERCAAVDIYRTQFRPLMHTLSGRNERMLMKLIVDADSDRVVGCHVLGPDAAEIVQSVAIAIRLGARKADFDATRALHPSAAEELVTLRHKWESPKKLAAE